MCRQPTDSETHADFPFCSERCKLLDLGNWAAERYVISEPAVHDESSDTIVPDPDEPAT
jgi:endogenous inhibitor of DNA gyrase (YacG/DUF329 family)